MAPSPEEQISPELVLVDPVLRERLLSESLQELLLGSLDPPPRAPAPPSPVARVPAPAASAAPYPRHRKRRRLPSALTGATLAALLVVLPSLAFLPPRQAPRLGVRPVAAPLSQAIAWPRDLDADYYVVELSLRTVVVKRVTTRQPFVTLTGEVRPGRYSWRVLVGKRDRPGILRGPVAAGTVTVD